MFSEICEIPILRNWDSPIGNGRKVRTEGHADTQTASAAESYDGQGYLSVFGWSASVPDDSFPIGVNPLLGHLELERAFVCGFLFESYIRVFTNKDRFLNVVDVSKTRQGEERLDLSRAVNCHFLFIKLWWRRKNLPVSASFEKPRSNYHVVLENGSFGKTPVLHRQPATNLTCFDAFTRGLTRDPVNRIARKVAKEAESVSSGNSEFRKIHSEESALFQARSHGPEWPGPFARK
jgi:hypothetical protein